MGADEFLRFLDIVAWPAVAFVALVVVHRHFRELFGGARVTVNIAGQEIETTLPEVERILAEHDCGGLTREEHEFLRELYHSGKVDCPGGITDESRRHFYRKLRNAGLIRTEPMERYLQNIEAVAISGLGKLYVRASEQSS